MYKGESFFEGTSLDSGQKEIITTEVHDVEYLDSVEIKLGQALNSYIDVKNSEAVKAIILASMANIIGKEFVYYRNKEKEEKDSIKKHKTDNVGAPRYAEARLQGLFERMMLSGAGDFVFTEMLPHLKEQTFFDEFQGQIKACITGARSVNEFVRAKEHENDDVILGTSLEADAIHKIDIFEIRKDEKDAVNEVDFIQVKSSFRQDEVDTIHSTHQKFLNLRLKAQRKINSEKSFEIFEKNAEQIGCEITTIRDAFIKQSFNNQLEFDTWLREFSRNANLSLFPIVALHRFSKVEVERVYNIIGSLANNSFSEKLISYTSSFKESPFESNKFHKQNAPDSVLSAREYYSKVYVGSKLVSSKEMEIKWID